MSATKHDRALTTQQEAFCLILGTPDAKGKYPTQKDAYLRAYPDCESDRQAINKSVLLMRDPRIRAQVEAMRADVRREYVESQVPFADVVKQIKAGLGAKVAKTASHEGKIEDVRYFADHPTRARYVELALKLTGAMPAEKQELSGPGGGPISIDSKPYDFSGFTKEELLSLRQLSVKLHGSEPTEDSDPAGD